MKLLQTGLLATVVFMGGCMPPPPADTRDADIKAVKETEAQWVKDANSKDVEKWVNHYSADASLLFPNAPILNGSGPIREALKPFMADPNFSLNFSSNRVEAAKSGDLVVTQGTYKMTFSGPGNEKLTDDGKYITVFRKQVDGTWKAVQDMLNSDLPLPPPPQR